MMHLCRSLFPSILEKEGLLFELLDSHFERSKLLYDDICNNYGETIFRRFIYSLVDENFEMIETGKTVEELMDIAGYKIYQCKTEEEIQEFKKYYAPNEALCTFKGDRLSRSYVFFAVKKNVDEIIRENFKDPKREDEYGTSVIGIQFSRIDNLLVILNRYNHTVMNPDSTFGNNLENIIPGLTAAFEREYGFNVKYNKYNFELNNYMLAADGKFYKTNLEHDNIYYGPNNIIIDNGRVVEKYKDKAKYLLIDYFIIDIPNRRIFTYDEKINDCFKDIYDNFEKIEIEKNGDNKILHITYKDKTVEIGINKNSQIISLKDNKIDQIGDNFLKLNKTIGELELDNVKKIGHLFLLCNKCLENINLPSVIEIGTYFLNDNMLAKNFEAPNLEIVLENFLYQNQNLKYINVKKLKKVGDYFLTNNLDLREFCATYLEEVGTHFLSENRNLEIIDLPSLKVAGSFCLTEVQKIKSICFENLVNVGYGFMQFSKNLENINLPKAIYIGAGFLRHNQKLMLLNAPNVIEIEDGFLASNKNLEVLILPKVKKISNLFLSHNENLSILIAPNLEEFGDDCLEYNNTLEYLYLDSLSKAGDNLLRFNKCLKNYYAPKQEIVRYGSFLHTKNIQNITLANNCDIFYQCFNTNDQSRQELIDSIRLNGNWEKGYSKKKTVA